MPTIPEIRDILAHRRIWVEELEKLETQRSNSDKKLKSFLNDLVQQEQVDHENRLSLQKKLFETLTFPIEYFEISKSTVLDGFDKLCDQAVDLECEIQYDSKILSCFHTIEINPWEIDQGSGELDEEQRKYKQQLIELKYEFKGYIDCFDRWNPESHFRFEKLRLEYKNGPDKKLFLNRLAAEFPRLSSDNLKA
ncbi:hypothetical protein HK100_004897 [Physocladia obscura]|uniref:Uncharacterized protein n=1 Tax=Physocladia obscura TaxID=109957 RepID=A0AAD5T7U9_9FUNG|nr:hypothetical protein HK100_004897 [Physocladia obscura]